MHLDLNFPSRLERRRRNFLHGALLVSNQLPGEPAIAGFKTFAVGDVPDGSVLRVQAMDAAEIIRDWRSNCFQCLPPSVVRRRVPALPAIQQTLSEGAEPARRSAVTPLFCGFQVLPASVERSIFPAGPTRQTCLLFGETMKLRSSTCNMEKLRPVTGASAAVTSTVSVIE